MVAALGAVADLGDRGQVDDLVDLAVAAAVMPMTDDVTRTGIQRGGAVERGKVPACREPAHVSDDRHDGRGSHVADAVDLGKRAAVRHERVADASSNVGDASVQPAPVFQQLPGDLFAFHVDCGHRTQRPQQLGCLGDRQTQLGAPWLEFGQQRVQPADGLLLVGDQMPESVDKQPEHD